MSAAPKLLDTQSPAPKLFEEGASAPFSQLDLIRLAQHEIIHSHPPCKNFQAG